MDYKKVVFDYLSEKISQERVLDSIREFESKLPTSERSDKSYWYANSYRSFISYFQQSKGLVDIDTWSIKVAMVYSWIASIPSPNFEVIEELVNLEKVYGDLKLWDVGIESYLGGQGNPDREKHHGELLFSVPNGVALIRDFLEPANILLNNGTNWDTTISTTSKLLHFTFPQLFPIMDSVVCEKIFGSGRRDYRRYTSYIWGLKDYIEKTPWLLDISEKHGYSPLKLIDLVIFI